MDLLTMALACDLTRVASMQWSRSVSQVRFTWLNVPDGHHDLSHRSDDDSDAVNKLTLINTWYAQQMADLDRAAQEHARRRRRHAVRQHPHPLEQRAGQGEHPQPAGRPLRAGRQRGRRASDRPLRQLRGAGAAAQQHDGVDPQRARHPRHDLRQGRLVHGPARRAALMNFQQGPST